MGLVLKNYTGAPITIRTAARDVNLAAEPLNFEVNISKYQTSELFDLGEASPVEIPVFLPVASFIGFPDPQEGVVLIVPNWLAAPLSFRGDVVTLGLPIMDGEGKLEAYSGLVTQGQTKTELPEGKIDVSVALGFLGRESEPRGVAVLPGDAAGVADSIGRRSSNRACRRCRARGRSFNRASRRCRAPGRRRARER